MINKRKGYLGEWKEGKMHGFGVFFGQMVEVIKVIMKWIKKVDMVFIVEKII